MNTTNKTVLITGGGTGIGFSIAQKLSANKIILVGRREDKLKAAVKQLPDASYIVADITNEKDVNQLVKQVDQLDILVNNAGVVTAHPLDSADGVYDKAKFEIELNYLSVVRLTEKLLPKLKASKEAAIINVESIVSYLPAVAIPTYSASKAALHSYSQSLRLVLEKTNVKVFEVFPPYVDTDMTAGIDVQKISPEEVAQDIVDALQNNQYDIRSGQTKEVYHLFHHSPETALKVFNGL